MPIRWSELQFAFFAANADVSARAWIHRTTGAVRMVSDLSDLSAGDEPPPEGDPDWVALPKAEELDLKQTLVRQFAYLQSEEQCRSILAFLAHEGAWRSYKKFLVQEGLIDEWHRFEDAARYSALQRWMAEKHLTAIRDERQG